MGNSFLLVLLLLIIFPFTCSSPSNATHFLCRLHQSRALLQFISTFSIDIHASDEFYNEFGVPSYPKTESWKEGTDCCSSWDGVTCDEVTGHVIELDLSCSQLVGTIHSNISLFSPHIAPNLHRLNLAFNDFQGSNISSEFGVKFSSSLTHLNLSYSHFGGNIPSEISHLLNLVSLDLSYNLGLRIESDRVLEKIAQNLTHLRELVLSEVDMSSLVHASSSLMNLSSSLTSLYLNDCELQGQFPASLLLRPNLQKLHLLSNRFSPIIPLPDFNSTTNLTSLYLDDIDLSSASIGFLDFIGNLKSLRDLLLRNCSLSGLIPTSFRNMTHLRLLVLRSNRLSGPVPSLICNLVYLEIFSLSHNRFVGSIPPCLGNLSRLSVLNLGMNHLHGTILNTFTKNSSLNYLTLSNNQLRGRLPHSLSQCQHLEVLDVGNNMIEDVFPHWLEILSPLQVLVLRSNKFFGSVDGFKSHSSFPGLRILDVSDNNLSGRLPMKLIKNLEVMVGVRQGRGYIRRYMRASNITFGSIDYSMTITAKGLKMDYERILNILTVIDFSRNRFEGDIPLVIGKLNSLIGLNLSHNLLTGHIPLSMGGLVSLEWLDLSSNKLDGHIPKQLAELPFLEVLNLSHNQLDGPIPQGKQFNTFDKISYKGNSGLCGLPLSKACGANKESPSEKGGASSLDSASGFSWECAFVGYGCGIVFGLFMGYLVFSSGWPKWFVRMVEGKQRRGRTVKTSRRSVQKNRGGRRN